MKTIIKKIFSFSLTDSENTEKNDNIELLNCPLKEMMCKAHLSQINNFYRESEMFRLNNDFNGSIDNLKNAFYKASELMEHPCKKCAQQYRSNIYNSIISIHTQLGELTKGIFGDKSYQLSYLKADNILKEIGKLKIHSTVQINETKIQFLGNFLN